MSPFPLLRRLHHEHYRSGTELAAELGVTRASVSLALKAAVALGAHIDVVKGLGYKLAKPVSWLNEPAVAQALGEQRRFFDLQVFEEIDSTNSALMIAASKGAPAGLVYAAERQTAGRGRRGRRWQGELGDALMFSLLWRFQLGVADLSGLSLAVGLAVIRALTQLGMPQARLKWPNDIVTAQGDKLGGILIELAGEAHGPSSVVIGIGLNVQLSDDARQTLDQAATSLAALGFSGDRNALLAAVLTELAFLLPAFAEHGFAPLLAEWESHHAMQGAAAYLLQPDDTRLVGVVLGVAADGALRFQHMGGERRFHAGEVSLRRSV